MDEFDQKKKEETVQPAEGNQTPSPDEVPNIEQQPAAPDPSAEQKIPQSEATSSVPQQTAEQQQGGYYPPYGSYPAGASSPYSGVHPGCPQQPPYPQNPSGYGYPNYPYHPVQQYYQQPNQGWGPAPVSPAQGKKWSASKVVCVVVAAILELVLVGFSVFGIYALCTGNYGYRQSTAYGQNGYYQPSINDGGNNDAEGENTTSVRMGLTCAMLTDEQAASINVSSGMIIMGIDSDSDARNQDISIGDVITHIDGTAITSFDDYYQLMENKQPGDTVELTVVKVQDTQNDQGIWDTETVQVTLALLERTTTESRYPET